MQNQNGDTIRTMMKMSEGLIQYYKEELAAWTRALAFYTAESADFVSRISAVLRVQSRPISASDEKEMNAFIDQFAVQQQEFDHLANQVTAQKLKLETMKGAGSADDAQTTQRHDVLRSHMLKAERNFMKSKYSCSAFLPSTFG